MGVCGSCSTPDNKPPSANQNVESDLHMMKVTGKRRALLCGINYVGSRAELRGCINDVNNQKRALIEHFGFKEEDIRLMNEEQPKELWPYKSNIMEGFKWLYDGAQAGDLLVFQYSGHGSQFEGEGGLADCICPMDCLDKTWPDAVILDREIHAAFYTPLPKGCLVVALFDCCHSGTVANLTVKRDINLFAPKSRYLQPPDHAAPKASRAIAGIRRRVMAEEFGDHKLWVFSGCQDDQTSADAYCDGTYQGAFTWALMKALREDVWHKSYLDLLGQIKANLRGYTQIPALTTTHASYLESWYMAREPAAATPDTEDAGLGPKRALLIGINYRGSPFELRGCINDVQTHRDMLVAQYGFGAKDMLILTEDEPKDNWPYKKRIEEGMKWLVDGAKVGDTLYLAYSGHGSQMTDTTGTEPNGMSDCICPLDCDKPWPEHIILDTEIHKHVYDQLPDGVRLVCVFDSCHSGTIADLEVSRALSLVPSAPEHYSAVRYMAPPAAVAKPAEAASSEGKALAPAKGSGVRCVLGARDAYKGKHVWVFSGCQDDQTSADAYEDGRYQGAFTWALSSALAQRGYVVKYGEALSQARTVLRGKYTQKPALSTTTEANFDRYFLGRRPPAGKAKGKA